MTRTVGFLGLAAFLINFATPAAAQGAHCFAHELPDRYQTDAFFSETMHFNVLQQGNKRVLVVEGGFDRGSADRFRQFLSSAGVIDELWFNSPGGSVADGLSMGRQIRAAGLFVRVPAEFACVSSCTLAFLGGLLRQVDDGAYYGVHMFSNYKDYRDQAGVKQLTGDLDILTKLGLERYTRLKTAKTQAEIDEINSAYAKEMMDLLRGIEESSAKAARELAGYIVEMSASMKFLNDMFDQPQIHECYLDKAGLLEYNVSNVK